MGHAVVMHEAQGFYELPAIVAADVDGEAAFVSEEVKELAFGVELTGDVTHL